MPIQLSRTARKAWGWMAGTKPASNLTPLTSLYRTGRLSHTIRKVLRHRNPLTFFLLELACFPLFGAAFLGTQRSIVYSTGMDAGEQGYEASVTQG